MQAGGGFQGTAVRLFGGQKFYVMENLSLATAVQRLSPAGG